MESVKTEGYVSKIDQFVKGRKLVSVEKMEDGRLFANFEFYERELIPYDLKIRVVMLLLR